MQHLLWGRLATCRPIVNRPSRAKLALAGFQPALAALKGVPTPAKIGAPHQPRWRGAHLSPELSLYYPSLNNAHGALPVHIFQWRYRAGAGADPGARVAALARAT